jgi:hypothetical protein
MDKKNCQEKSKTSQQTPLFTTSRNILDSLARAVKNGEKIELVPFRKWQNLRNTNIDTNRSKVDFVDNKTNLNQAI